MDAKKKRGAAKEVMKTDRVLIRLTPAQKEILRDAARERGLGISTWLLTLGLRAARR